jgi:type VI secretion system protein VasI
MQDMPIEEPFEITPAIAICREITPDDVQMPPLGHELWPLVADIEAAGIQCPALVAPVARRIEIDGVSYGIDIQSWKHNGVNWVLMATDPAGPIYYPSIFEARENWTLSFETDPVTDTRNVFAANETAPPISLDFGRRAFPNFQIHCYSNRTQVYLHFAETYLGRGPTQVVYRIDNEAPVQSEWQISNAGDSIGLFNGAASIPFLRELAGREQLIVRFTPFNENQWTVTIDIEGLDEPLGEVSAACSWTMPGSD